MYKYLRNDISLQILKFVLRLSVNRPQASGEKWEHKLL